jgi:protein SCO1
MKARASFSIDRRRCLGAGALSLLAARAQAHGAHERNPSTPGAPSAVHGERLNLPDTRLLDHEGRERRLASEVLADRIAVVGFFYTTCGTVCPVLSQLMLQVQTRLGARAGREVTLVSLTVDPLRDTVPRLGEYRRSLGAGEGWVWLTGARPQVEEALRAFGAYSADPAQHPSQLLVGDARGGRWLRLNGFPSVQQVLDAVAQAASARARAGGA